LGGDGGGGAASGGIAVQHEDDAPEMTVPIANLELDENIGFAHLSSRFPLDA
jgi:hypothetical protein